MQSKIRVEQVFLHVLRKDDVLSELRSDASTFKVSEMLFELHFLGRQNFVTQLKFCDQVLQGWNLQLESVAIVRLLIRQVVYLVGLFKDCWHGESFVVAHEVINQGALSVLVHS